MHVPVILLTVTMSSPTSAELHLTQLQLLHHPLLLSITPPTVIFFISLNHCPSFTCQCDPYVPNLHSLHPQRLLSYYLTTLSLLQGHFSIAGLVVLLIHLSLKQVPFIIIFHPSYLPFTSLIKQISPTSIITFLIYYFFPRNPITAIPIINTLPIKHIVSFTDSVFQFIDTLILVPITEPIILLTRNTIFTTSPPFPSVSFPSCFRSIKTINFTFYPTFLILIFYGSIVYLLSFKYW